MVYEDLLKLLKTIHVRGPIIGLRYLYSTFRLSWNRLKTKIFLLVSEKYHDLQNNFFLNINGFQKVALQLIKFHNQLKAGFNLFQYPLELQIANYVFSSSLTITFLKLLPCSLFSIFVSSNTKILLFNYLKMQKISIFIL